MVREKTGVARVALAASVAMGAMTGLAVAPASAQESQAAQETGIADIVVTAQKREENLQDTPISMVALGAEALEVGHAARGDAAVVAGHQLQRPPAEHPAAGVEVIDRGPGAEEDGVVRGAVGVHELRIHPDPHRCRAPEGAPGQAGGEQPRGAGMQEAAATLACTAHRDGSVVVSCSTVSINWSGLKGFVR